MKIAIISDSHDNLANLEKTVNILKEEKVKIIFHCGDFSTVETLEEFFKIFPGKIYLSLGNADFDFLQKAEDYFKKFKRLKLFKEIGKTKISNKKIAFVHFPEIARKLAEKQEYDFVFYGHSHKPWYEKVGRSRLINPGNLAGLIYRASFAIYNIKVDKLELKIIK